MNFYSKVTAAAGLLIVVALAFLFLWPNADAQELEHLSRQLFQWAKRGKLDECMKHVHKEYSYNGETLQDLRHRARVEIGRKEVPSYELLDADAEVSGDDGRVRLDIQIEWEGMRRPIPLVLHFRRFDGEWKVTGYDVPTSGF